MGIKDLKKEYVIKTASELFIKKSVAEVTIKDVADTAGVGEATVYRYFTNKKNLVVLSGVYMQQKVYENFYGFSGNSGYERLCAFYNVYLEIFVNHREYYKFINEFDAFMLSEGVESMEEYSDGLEVFRKQFTDAYSDGIKDGSVKEIKDVNSFYYSTTHSLMGLCKKLSYGKNIVRQDGTVDKTEEIKTLTEIILTYLKK
ncbi:MAG: TetR/AcrR family transcriptional regulator [Clostridia bacterium]|nr:TetR/AcrR family transcriptional regulator [Clostridia bacterium]